MSKQQDLLKLDPRFLGLTSLHSFSPYNSASRSVMFLGQLSQFLQLTDADERIIKNGIEDQLGTTTFKKVIQNESKIVGKVSRYQSNTNETLNKNIEETIFYMIGIVVQYCEYDE